MPLGGLENTGALEVGVGAALATATGTSPYSGFNDAIQKWGMGIKASIARDLKWQRDVDGNPQKTTQFKEVVGGLQDFRTYLFMKPGSAFVTVMHSPMKFVAISKATQHLQGRFIGFVGDRTPMKDPILIVLPQQKTWSWETKTVSTDAAAMDAYYTEDSTCRGKLWAPPTGKAGGEAAVKAPILLAILLVLFQVIWDEKRALMPHDIHALAVAIVTNSPDVEKARTDWELVLSWCLMASQMNTSGNSHLSLAVEAVTEGDDDYLVRWIDQRLDSTFGPRTGKGSTGHNDRGGMALLAHDQAQVSAIMASEVGKGVALGLRAAGHLHRDATNIGGGYNSEGGKGYTKDDIATLMGFAGVYSGNNLPDIWELFNLTKGKNINAYPCHLYSRMKQYAYDRRIQIDTSVYLEQETILSSCVSTQEKVLPTSPRPQRDFLFWHAGLAPRKKPNGSANRNKHCLPRRKRASWTISSSYQKELCGHQLTTSGNSR